MLRCFHLTFSSNYGRLLSSDPLELALNSEKVRTQKAENVTLEELALYVLDGIPIKRKEKEPQIVYGEEPKPDHADVHEKA